MTDINTKIPSWKTSANTLHWGTLPPVSSMENVSIGNWGLGADSNVRCFLCKCNVNYREWSSHKSGRSHSLVCNKIKKEQQEITDTLPILHFGKNMSSLLDQYQESWQIHIQALWFRAATASTPSKRLEFMEEAQGEFRKYQIRYEMKVRLSIFATALCKWRAFAMMDTAGIDSKNYIEIITWTTGGWKGYKREAFESRELNIVMELVFPFLVDYM